MSTTTLYNEVIHDVEVTISECPDGLTATATIARDGRTFYGASHVCHQYLGPDFRESRLLRAVGQATERAYKAAAKFEYDTRIMGLSV